MSGLIEHYSKQFSILTEWDGKGVVDFIVERNCDHKQLEVTRVEWFGSIAAYTDQEQFKSRLKAKFDELKTKYVYDYQGKTNCH